MRPVRVAVVIGVAVARQAVLAALLGEGGADMAPRADPGQAGRQGAGVVEAALDPVEALFVVIGVMIMIMIVVVVVIMIMVVVIAMWRGVEGHAVVVCPAKRALQPEREAAAHAQGGAEHAGALAVGRAQPRLADPLDAFGGQA